MFSHSSYIRKNVFLLLMPKGQSRLSAVARQRSLRNRAALPVAQPGTNIGSQETAKDGVVEDFGQNEHTVQNEPLESHDTPSNENQFSSLVDSGNVSFISTRRIEGVNDTSVKVRLERGQKCVLLGTCSLWVKSGTIRVYGSSLTASTDTYRIYAPVTHALPSIESVSKHAEFQLDSVDDGPHGLPSVGYFHLWRPGDSSDLPGQSFHILGYSFDHNAKLFSRVKELNVEQWKQTLNSISPMRGSINNDRIASPGEVESSQAATILVHVERFSGVSTFFRCLINQFLTLRKPNGDLVCPRGVLVLDLNNDHPEFSPPGTLAVARIEQPVFGPPFTHVLQSGFGANAIIKAHFVGEVIRDNIPDWIFECVLDLRRIVKSQRASQGDLPILIKTSSWLNELNAKNTQALWSELGVSAVVCSDTKINSTLSKWREFLAGCQNYATYQLQDDILIHEHNRSREHDMHMQASFHVGVDQFGHLRWEPLPLLRDVCALQDVAYCGEAAVLKAIVILAEGIAMENTRDALEENIVAIVAVDYNEFEKLSSAGLIGTTSDDLPRLMITPDNKFPITARSSRFVGFAYVHTVDSESGTLQVYSPFRLEHWQSVNQTTEVVVFMIHRGLPDKRYQSRWINKELEDGEISGDSRELDNFDAESPSGQEDS